MPLECHCGGEKLSKLQNSTKHKNIAENIKLFIMFKSHMPNKMFEAVIFSGEYFHTKQK